MNSERTERDPVGPRKSAVYMRVSTEDQNLNLQESLLLAQKPDLVYSDKESGMIAERRAYTRLCNDIGLGRISSVLVYRLDRLGRDPIELIRFFNQLERKHVKFISLTEPWLTDWNQGPWQFRIWWEQLGSARFELLLMKDRQRRGISDKKKRISEGKDSWQGRGPDRNPRKKAR
jgi:DNA invertase Pin-like site-specific DNA recombinase